MKTTCSTALAGLLLAGALSACASTATTNSTGATTGAVSTIAPTATTDGAGVTVVPSATTGAAGRTATSVAGSTVRPSGTTRPGPVSTAQTPEVVVAGDIPDNQAFVAYTPPGAGYTIKVPEGWARSTDGAATVFSDKFNTIRVETIPMVTAPTVASVTSTELPAVAKTATGYKAGKVSAASRKAGQTIVATYQVDAPPNAVTTKTVRLDVERYEFWKAANAVVITLSSVAGSDNVDPWKTVTDGFAWVG